MSFLSWLFTGNTHTNLDRLKTETAYYEGVANYWENWKPWHCPVCHEQHGGTMPSMNLLGRHILVCAKCSGMKETKECSECSRYKGYIR